MRAELILAALAVVFAAVTIIDVMRKGRGWTPARRTWIKVAAIFALVSALLYFFK